MSDSLSEPLWIELSTTPPFTSFEQALPINNNEFLIVASTNFRERADGIYKYNANNKWIKIIDCNTDFDDKLEWDSAAVDAQNQLIYLCDSRSSIIEIDLKDKTMQTFNSPAETNDFEISIIYIKDTIHVFSSTKYYIFNKETKQFEKKATYCQRVIGWCSVFINSMQCVMRTIRKGSDAFISKFSLQNHKWTDCKVNAPYNSAIVITKNEQYLIFIGGYDVANATWTDLILVYDIKNNVFKQSIIKCPIKSFFTASLTRNDKIDEVLTFGFINRCFKSSDCCEIQPLPYYLLKLISNYVCNEKIHIINDTSFHDNNNKESKLCHWIINVDEIIRTN